MMIGHLTFAGIAELILAAGVVAYFQRTNPALLQRTAPGCRDRFAAENQSGWRSTRPLWAFLALLLVLAPPCILAGGSAWGEWSAHEFADPQGRAHIASASRNTPPPVDPPRELGRLSSLWMAPFPQYAFVRHPAIGYALSAMFGSGTIILVTLMA